MPREWGIPFWLRVVTPRWVPAVPQKVLACTYYLISVFWLHKAIHGCFWSYAGKPSTLAAPGQLCFLPKQLVCTCLWGGSSVLLGTLEQREIQGKTCGFLLFLHNSFLFVEVSVCLSLWVVFVLAILAETVVSIPELTSLGECWCFARYCQTQGLPYKTF